jgi:site-specific DNA recombinase
MHSTLSSRSKGSAPAPITIHPNAAEIYRRKVDELQQSLTVPDTRSSAAEALRGLIDEVRVTPQADGKIIEIVGELGALLQLSDSKNAAFLAEAARSTKLVAGAGFEPATFRL